MVKNNHVFRVPDHPVIAAMERYGEYRESRERERRRPLPGEEERGKWKVEGAAGETILNYEL